MSDRKHTPGPWNLSESHSGADRSVFALSPKHQNPIWIARVYNGDGSIHTPAPIRDANARLIAAAPDLLEACEETLRLHDLSEDDRLAGVIGIAIRAAIAKAKGDDNR